MKKYKVVTFTTGCMSGTLNPEKLQDVMNSEGAQGWRFIASIAEEKRVLILFKREAHFLIFERDASEETQPATVG